MTSRLPRIAWTWAPSGKRVQVWIPAAIPVDPPLADGEIEIAIDPPRPAWLRATTRADEVALADLIGAVR